MSKAVNRFRGYRVLMVSGSLVLVIAGLRAAQPLLVPFLFSVFLAILGTPPMTWLTRRKVPSWLAVLLVALAIISACVGLGLLLATSANRFTTELPKYRTHLLETAASLQAYLEGKGFGSESLLDYFSPASVMDFFGGALKGAVGALSKTFLVFILMIFMLVEAADLQVKLRLALPKGADLTRLEHTTYDVQRYLAIKTATSLITGALVMCWTAIMNIDFPFLWGLIAFILNYVPFIGSVIASVPAILLSLITHGAGGVVVLGAGYLVVNIGVSNFLEPILMGRRLGLSPLIVLLSLAFWGWVWGPAGALMSVPLTMIVKILLDHSEEFRWVAILMDTKPRIPKGDSGVV